MSETESAKAEILTMEIFYLVGKNVYLVNLILNQMEFDNNSCTIGHFVDLVLHCLFGWERRKQNMTISLSRLH